jgi:hypothetical protein
MPRDGVAYRPLAVPLARGHDPIPQTSGGIPRTWQPLLHGRQYPFHGRDNPFPGRESSWMFHVKNFDPHSADVKIFLRCVVEKIRA